MSQTVELVLLKCGQCGTPVPAEEDEVAWVCATCGQGWRLTDDGLAPQAVHWARASRQPKRWQPVWVFNGTVTFQRRENYGGRSEPDGLWRSAQRLYVPAYPCGLEELQSVGANLTRQQYALTPGPAAGQLSRCTLLPEDARRAAEFVVISIEASRRDKLKSLSFTINAREPELWLLPFD